MRFSAEGEITIAYCRHCNGEGTPKELEIEAVFSIDDPDIWDDEDRWANFRFSIPCSRESRLGDHDQLIGKRIRIEIG